MAASESSRGTESPGRHPDTGVAANLLLGVWLRSLTDLQRLEAALTRRVGQLRVLDRSIGLRTVKRMGRLLDDAGRAVGHVPVDPWASPH